MKLRIRANSLRLRLSQTEVQKIRGGHLVRELIEFGDGPNQSLEYAIRTQDDLEGPTAEFTANRIVVTVPARMAALWVDDDTQVAMSGEMPIGSNGKSLRILVEKDFACLAQRDKHEDDSDAFPNPNAAAGVC